MPRQHHGGGAVPSPHVHRRERRSHERDRWIMPRRREAWRKTGKKNSCSWKIKRLHATKQGIFPRAVANSPLSVALRAPPLPHFVGARKGRPHAWHHSSPPLGGEVPSPRVRPLPARGQAPRGGEGGSRPEPCGRTPTMQKATSICTAGMPHHRSSMDSRRSPLLPVAREVGNDGSLWALRQSQAENGGTAACHLPAMMIGALRCPETGTRGMG